MAEKLQATPPPAEAAVAFKPYVPPDQAPKEFTVKAVILGAIFGLIFGAVTVYLALRAGLTVSASIPIAVLAIAVFKRLGRATILENNIVQTAGSAGESIAAGVAFTIPALIFLGFAEYFTVSRIFLVALVGGCLGVLFMIPMRRYLIVKEHGNLLYPEGTACADVLVAGERGGSFAGKVFWGLGIGAAYKFLMEGFQCWKDTPTYDPPWYPGGRLAGNITPEYLGVGYIIGPRIAGTIFAGGVLSWLFLIPAIKFFGGGLTTPIFPGTVPIADMSPSQIWGSYIRPIGAGAVAMAGLFTLWRTIPTIVESFRAGARDLMSGREGRRAEGESRSRTEQDLPLTLVAGGSLALVVVIWALLQFSINPGWVAGNFIAAVLMVIFGFLFVTVSSRIVGIIGSSANPISGMTIATLMATSLIFVLLGWTAGAFPAVALSIGAIVCIAAANAGATSQDLKTGFLVGATPWRQQVALIVGALASVLVIGYTITYLNRSESRVRDVNLAVDARALPGAKSQGSVEHQGRQYERITVIGSRQVPDGTYYVDAATGQIRYQLAHGIGSERMPAPQALLMSTVINGILSRNLPWGLVLLGVFVVITIELCGVRSLSFAVGAYLPISTTATIFAGSVVRWLVDRQSKAAGAAAHGESEVGSGQLFSSGLIAGGSLVGLLVVAPIRANRLDEQFAVGRRMLGSLAANDVGGLVAFLALAAILYWFALKPLEQA